MKNLTIIISQLPTLSRQAFAPMRVLFSIAVAAVVVTMASCGNKTAKGGDNVPAAVPCNQNEQVRAADSAATTAPEELWTVEAVETQVRKIYDRLNDMDKNGIINIRQLEDEFCTSYYLGLRNAISKTLTEAMGDDHFFMADEEGYRFLAGMGTPMEIETIKAELLTGDMAQAQVRFKGADKERGVMRLELDFENGQWRVKNFSHPEAFGPGGYLKIMQDFAGEHGICYEGIPSPKGDDSDAEECDDDTRSKDRADVELLDINEMPKTAVRQPNAHFQHAVYVNIDKPASGEGEMDAVYSVWLADERAGTVIKVCVTNPMADAQWQRMNGKDADAVDVPITQIASAEKAYIAPGDVSKVIVEGCPDGRNMWTYIIDPYKGTAKQLPSTEGVVALEWKKKEIITSSYGYGDDGRYSVTKAYSLEGKFLC